MPVARRYVCWPLPSLLRLVWLPRRGRGVVEARGSDTRRDLGAAMGCTFPRPLTNVEGTGRDHVVAGLAGGGGGLGRSCMYLCCELRR